MRHLIHTRERCPARLVLVVAVLFAGCGGEGEHEFVAVGDEVTDVDFVDSAGIRVDTDPVFTIGGARRGSGQNLYIVSDAALLSDGSLVVLNRGSKSLELYDSTGEWLETIGREGEGPGEFQAIWRVFRTPDGFAVWDRVAQRVTRYDTLGEFNEDFTIPVDSTGPGFRAVLLHEVDGRYLAISTEGYGMPNRADPGFSRDLHELAVLDSTGAAVRHLGAYPGNETYTSPEQWTVAAPLSYRFHHAATGSALFLNDGRSADLVRIPLRADRESERLRLPIRRQPMAGSEWEEYRDGWLARFVAKRLHDSLRDMLDDALRVDSFPAVTELVAATNGDLWVRLYDPAGQPRRWLVVDPDAGVARSALIPFDAILLEATDGRIVLLFTDEFDREEVRVYALTATDTVAW